MHRFWERVILPLFNRIKPEVIVEIGSFKGNNTRNILSSYCSIYNAELISIDPNPHSDFDLEYFKKEFKDNFKFFNNMSLEVLPFLTNYDVILIDGDHNWYTVFNELKTIEKNFSQDSFPFVIFHDVSWPYARRDLYYNPDSIPPEFRHPYMKLPVVPGVEKLSNFGLNENFNHAIHENTPKNGVLTAIEDFIEDSPLDLAFFSINVFYGLGILCQNTEKNRRLLLELFYESDMEGVLENHYQKNKFATEKIIKNNNAKINSLNASYDELCNNFSILEDVNDDLKSQIDELEKIITNLKNNRGELENKISELNSSLKNLQSSVKTLKERIIEKENDLTSLNEVIAEKDNDLDDLRSVIDKHKENMSILKEDYALLLEDNKNLLNEISSLRKEIHDIKSEFSNELALKDEVIYDLENLNEDQLILISELKKENEELKHSVDSLMSSKSWKMTEPLRKFRNFFR